MLSVLEDIFTVLLKGLYKPFKCPDDLTAFSIHYSKHLKDCLYYNERILEHLMTPLKQNNKQLKVHESRLLQVRVEQKLI